MRNAISVLLLPQPQPPPLLPIITVVDHHHMLQTLQNHTLGIPALMISATAVVALAYSVNFLGAEPHNYTISGFMVAIAFILAGIFLGKIYLQGVGIVLCVISLFALGASSLPIAFACAVGICGAGSLGTILYTLIKHHQAA